MIKVMELKSGMRIRSLVSAVEIVVVKAPGGEVDLRCGGHTMVPKSDEVVELLPIEPDHTGALAVGKRYSVDGGALEVMVTKGGEGLLSVGGAPLDPKDAKQLPSSD